MEEDGRLAGLRAKRGAERRTGRRRFLGRMVAGWLFAGLAVGCSVYSAPRYRGPAPREAPFDGEQFQNLEPFEPRSGWDLARWMFARERGPWRDWTDAPPGPPPPPHVGKGEMRVTFVNHATTLVQMDGLNILTDPVWSSYVGPTALLSNARMRPPGIRFEDLPRIHAVVISHNHYDHMDLPTLRRLGRVHRPRFFVGLGNRTILNQAGISNVVELDWWQSVRLRKGVRLIFVPAQHGSNRGMVDRNRTLWGGFVIEGEGGYAYFAGDTGFGPHFAWIRERFGPPRLAILPIGAFRPEWFMQPVHVSPAEAVRAHLVMEAHRSVAMHFGTFRLADDGQDEPVEQLLEALARAGVEEDRFWVLDFGEGRSVPPLPASEPAESVPSEPPPEQPDPDHKVPHFKVE